MDDVKAIGVNIRNARKVAGITQGTLQTVVAAANAVGLRLGTIDG